MNDFYWENHGRGFFMVTQISVAGTLIACHLFIFQIIVHFFKTKKLLPPSHQSSTWSMDRSLLHISFLRLFIIRDTFINKVNYALACRFAPFFSIINFNEKKITHFCDPDIIRGISFWSNWDVDADIWQSSNSVF